MKVKCPRCKAEYDLLDDALSKVDGWVCPKCWYESYLGKKELEKEGQCQKVVSP